MCVHVCQNCNLVSLKTNEEFCFSKTVLCCNYFWIFHCSVVRPCCSYTETSLQLQNRIWNKCFYGYKKYKKIYKLYSNILFALCIWFLYLYLLILGLNFSKLLKYFFKIVIFYFIIIIFFHSLDISMSYWHFQTKIMSIVLAKHKCFHCLFLLSRTLSWVTK